MPQATPHPLLPRFPSPAPIRAAIRQLLRLQPRLDLHMAVSLRHGASFTARLVPRGRLEPAASSAQVAP